MSGNHQRQPYGVRDTRSGIGNIDASREDRGNTLQPPAQTTVEDEFDAFGSVALQHYEQTQHSSDSVGQQQPSDEPGSFHPHAQAILGHLESPSRGTTGTSGLTPAIHRSEQGVAVQIIGGEDRMWSLEAQLQEAQKQIAQLTEQNYCYSGEVKNLRDRMQEQSREKKQLESDFKTLKASRDVEIAHKEAERKEAEEHLRGNMIFLEREKNDEIAQRLAAEQKNEYLLSLQNSAQPSTSPQLPIRSKRPHPQSSNKSDFPSTKTFLGSVDLTTSTPLHFSKSDKKSLVKEDHLQPGSPAKLETVTPMTTPTLGSVCKVTPNQLNVSSTIGLAVGDNSPFRASYRSIVVPEEEGFPLLVEDVKVDPVIPAPELLQRLLESHDIIKSAHLSSTSATSSAVNSDAHLTVTPADGNVSSPAVHSTESNSPSDGLLSLLTCPNPMYVAATTDRSTPSSSSRIKQVNRMTKLLSHNSKASITPLHKAAINADRKRRFESTASDSTSHSSLDTYLSSSSDISFRFVSHVTKINPLLLTADSQQQLQSCIQRMLAPAGTPINQLTSDDHRCTPITSRSMVPSSAVAVEDDGGLCLLNFLQTQIIAYYQEYGEPNSCDNSTAHSTDSSDSWSYSSKGTSSASSSSKKSFLDTSVPVLQFLKVLCTLVKYSPVVREKMREFPPKLDYGSRPQSSLGTDSSSSPSMEVSPAVTEVESQDSASMKQSISDQSSSSLSRVETDTQSSESSNLSGPGSQSVVRLVPGDLTMLRGKKMAPCRFLKKVYTSHTLDTLGAAEQFHDSLYRDSELSLEAVQLNTKFLRFLLNLLQHQWCRDPVICECILDILYYVAWECPVGCLERFRTLLTGPTSLLYLCLKQAQLDPRVVASVAKLLTTLVPLERITDVLCAKSETCVLLQLYDALSDVDVSNAEIPLHILRLFSAVVAHAKGGLECLFLSECCDCSLKAFHSLVQNISYRLPIQDVSKMPQIICVLFRDFVAFLDCINDRVLNSVNPNDLIFVIRNLYYVFTALPGCEREVEVLEGLQESDVFLESTEMDDMDTSALSSNK
jgi:regulator of replication initiation timing